MLLAPGAAPPLDAGSLLVGEAAAATAPAAATAAAEAQEAVANGYTNLKLKPRPWWDVLAQVEAIDQVVQYSFDFDPCYCRSTNGTKQYPA